MLVNSINILRDAKEKGYAIPSPDFINANMIRSYINVAEKLNLPAIIAISESLSNQFTLELAYEVAKYYSENTTIPVVLHLDHGKNVDFVKKAIDIGFTSVMIDASMNSFEENVRKTKEVVEYAHSRNVSVEAEIGHVGSGINYEDESGDSTIFTEVKDLVKFVELTNIDSVAVSVGTAHGIYIGEPKINFERLKELKEAVSIPLVLHGGSSSGDENLKKCVELGICKINVFTDLCIAGAKAIKETNTTNYMDYMEAADLAIEDMLHHYYSLCTVKLEK